MLNNKLSVSPFGEKEEEGEHGSTLTIWYSVQRKLQQLKLETESSDLKYFRSLQSQRVTSAFKGARPNEGLTIVKSLSYSNLNSSFSLFENFINFKGAALFEEVRLIKITLVSHSAGNHFSSCILDHHWAMFRAELLNDLRTFQTFSILTDSQ